MMGLVSRIIHTENLASDRGRLLKAMAIASRELAKQPGLNSAARDLAAFIVLALEGIAQSVERSVAPWEKRGYWLKADRFRQDWNWVQPLATQIRSALASDDSTGLAESLVSLGEKLRNAKIPAHDRLGQPWVGAWEKLQNKAQS